MTRALNMVDTYLLLLELILSSVWLHHHPYHLPSYLSLHHIVVQTYKIIIEHQTAVNKTVAMR